MFDIKVFADDWNRTADLWYWKLPLYRLSNKHCPDRILLITYLTIYNYKVYPIELKICQSRLESLPILKKPLKIANVFAKVVKFRKICTHWLAQM